MRTVGFELEFSSERITLNYEELKQKIQAIVSEHDSSHSVSSNESPSRWTLKTDHCGYELTSPALEGIEANFNKIYNIIEGLRTVVNEYRPTNLRDFENVCTPSCGFHVHIDVHDFSKRNLINLLTIFKTFENALLTIQPQSRRGNNYVYRINEFNNEDFDSSDDIIDEFEEHYNAVNFSSFNEYGTVEIRYGASTMMGRKVVNWVQLLLYLVQIAKKMEGQYSYQPEQTVIDLKRFLRQNLTGYQFLNSRRANLTRWIDRRVQDLVNFETARTERRAARQAEREARRIARETNNAQEATNNLETIITQEEN